MRTVTFSAQGGSLFAEVRSGHANPGAYTLLLWEKNSNDRAMPDRRGNFINTDDDIYELPGAAAENDGRIVESFITVSPPKPGDGQYYVAVRIIQDQVLLDEISYAGRTDDPTVTIDLYALLRGE